MRYRCWVAPSALGKLLAEANSKVLRETGGALLGWYEGTDYVVVDVLGPGPSAIHGFSHFEPDAEWQAAEGRRIYASSGRTVRYLGDWHTHPRGGCSPSMQDSDTAAEIATDVAFRTPVPLYAIMCRPWWRILDSESWTWRLYVQVDGALEDVKVLRYG